MNINSRTSRINFTGFTSGAIASFTGLRAAPVDIKSYISSIQSGSGTPSPDNIRPISGWSECNVVRCGVNVFDLNYLSASGITIQNGEASGTANNFNAAFGLSTDGLKSKFKFKPNTSYTISFKAYTDGNSSQSSNGLAIYFRYTDNTNLVITVPNNTLNYTYFSMTSLSSKSLKNIFISYATSGTNIWHIKEIQLEEGSTATAYEAYTGNTYTIALGDTCYGGSLNVTNGVLTVTHANIASYNGEPINEPWLCSEAVYSEGTTPPIGSQVVYPLATPITVQLTPTQIEQLLGANNIFADCGNVEVYYVTI